MRRRQLVEGSYPGPPLTLEMKHEAAEKLFEIVDKDMSDSIDQHEFKYLIEYMQKGARCVEPSKKWGFKTVASKSAGIKTLCTSSVAPPKIIEYMLILGAVESSTNPGEMILQRNQFINAVVHDKIEGLASHARIYQMELSDLFG